LSIELYLAFVLAASVLILIPGPNVTLIVANSLTYGARFAFTTIAGTTLAQIVQLSLTVAGMTAAMSAMAGWFDWLRWLGVAYLFCLGIRMWRSAPERMVDGAASSRRAGRLFWQGFLVSLTNPKTLLFYAAFLPQFVNPAVAPMPQFALLSLTLLVVSLLVVSLTFDSSYCLLAGRIRPWFRGAAVERLRNKVTGTLLVASGVGLALARRS
jgi:homoserine/homoserine lactone efflux protein